MNAEGTGSTRWIVGRLQAGDEAQLTLRGWSMAPSLKDGDRLRVLPYGRPGDARVGEIVVARRGALLVTHRLVALRGGEAVTRGDGCRRDDPPLPRAALLGRVVEVRRGTRRLSPPGPLRGVRLLVESVRRLARSTGEA